MKKTTYVWMLLLGLSLAINAYMALGYVFGKPAAVVATTGGDERVCELEEQQTRLLEYIAILTENDPRSRLHVQELLASCSPQLLASAKQMKDKDAKQPKQPKQGELQIRDVQNRWNLNEVYVMFNCEETVPVPKKLDSALSIEPAVPNLGARSLYSGSWEISGDFLPETNYVLTFHRGLASVSGNSLAADAVFNLRTMKSSPYCEFLSKGPYFPPSPTADKAWHCSLPVKLRNADSLSVSLLRYHPNNFSPFYGNSWLGRKYATFVATREVKLELPANEFVSMDLNVSDLFPALDIGVYQLDISIPGEYWRKDTIHLVISDLALVATRDDFQRQAYIKLCRLSDASPVADADLQLFSKKNIPVARGRTDAQGHAVLDYADDFIDPDDSVAMVVAQKDQDSNYLALGQQHAHGLAEFANHGRRFQHGPTAYVYTERGVCRPGESLTVSAWLRNFQHGRYQLMPSSPLLLTVLDPTGSVFSRVRLQTEEQGFASSQLSLPSSARTGYYTLNVGLDDKSVWGQCRVLVADYVPDRVQLSLIPQEEWVTTTAPSSFKADARYYFGDELPAVSYSFDVSAERSPPPAHWEGYVVGDAEAFYAGKIFHDEYVSLPEDRLLRYPGFAAMGGHCNEPVTLVAIASVSEPGGRSVSARALQRCEPAAVYLGLRHDGKNATTEEPRIACRMLSWDPGKEPVAKERSYSLKLKRLDWHYVQKIKDNIVYREWDLQRTELPCQETMILSQLHGEILLPPLPSGRYELEATGSNGLRSRLPFWHGAGEGGARSSNPHVLSFATDKPLYLPGERAQVTLNSPAAGDIFLVAGEHSLQYNEALPAQVGDNSFGIEIPTDCVGDQYFVGVTLVYWQEENLLRSFGLLKLPVDQKRHRLQLTLQAPTPCLPGEKIKVDVQLQGPDGAPCAGAVQLFAVDEGILALTGYKTPDIFSFFHGTYYCGFRFYDLYGYLFPKVKISNQGGIGGDGLRRELTGRLIDVKTEKPALLVLPLLSVPDSGTAQVEMSLPQHLGALRLMAVAAAGDAYGSQEQRIVMRNLLSVLPSAPLVLTPGDEGELSFTLINHECPEDTYSLQVSLPPVLTALSATSMSGQLARGESQRRTLRYKVSSEELGSYDISSSLQIAAQRHSARTPVTLRAANPPVKKTHWYSLGPGENMQVALDPEQWLSASEMRLRVSASPAIALEQAMNWLNEYSYGCLEQTTAKAFPFLAVDNLLKAGAISEAVAGTAKQKVVSLAERIMSMQLVDGSFAIWPGATKSEAETTIFAQHFLLAAEQQQLYELDPLLRLRIRRQLRRQGNSNASAARLGHASYVLAMLGDDAFASMARRALLEHSNNIEALWAAAALIKGGFAAEGMPHLERALAAELWHHGHVGDRCSTPASRYACALVLLMELQARHPMATKLATALAGMIREDESAWGTTQANAWACMGLAAYAAEYGLGKTSGTLSLASGKELPINSDSYFDMGLAVTEKGSLVNTGAQPFLVQISTRGLPRKMESQGNGMKIRRRYVDLEGNEITRAKHGQLIKVILTVDSPGEIKDLVLVDLLPSGLEIEDPRLATRSTAITKAEQILGDLLHAEFLERRDDRFLFFGDKRGAGAHEIAYTLRAVSRGSFVIPPLRGEAMYDPDIAATFVPGGLFVVE